jgi:hypothetical protein
MFSKLAAQAFELPILSRSRSAVLCTFINEDGVCIYVRDCAFVAIAYVRIQLLGLTWQRFLRLLAQQEANASIRETLA